MPSSLFGSIVGGTVAGGFVLLVVALLVIRRAQHGRRTRRDIQGVRRREDSTRCKIGCQPACDSTLCTSDTESKDEYNLVYRPQFSFLQQIMDNDSKSDLCSVLAPQFSFVETMEKGNAESSASSSNSLGDPPHTRNWQALERARRIPSTSRDT